MYYSYGYTSIMSTSLFTKLRDEFINNKHKQAQLSNAEPDDDEISEDYSVISEKLNQDGWLTDDCSGSIVGDMDEDDSNEDSEDDDGMRECKRLERSIAKLNKIGRNPLKHNHNQHKKSKPQTGINSLFQTTKSQTTKTKPYVKRMRSNKK